MMTLIHEHDNKCDQKDSNKTKQLH